MNYFFVIFLLCAVQPLRGRVINMNSTELLASVKEYPSFLHKCTATFIKPDVLITTAHCLFCEGYCTLFVEAGINSLTPHSAASNLHNVNYTIIHPEYEPNPEQNDIGLIILKEEVMYAAVFDLPIGYNEPRGVEALAFEWKFSENGRDFQLQANPGVGVSNAMCSLALNKYVAFPYVCALSSKGFSFGVFDNGTPLLGRIKNVWVLLGIYGRQGVYREVKIEIFQSIVPYLGWINQILQKMSETTPFFPPIREEMLIPNDDFNNHQNSINLNGGSLMPSGMMNGNTLPFAQNVIFPNHLLPPGQNILPPSPNILPPSPNVLPPSPNVLPPSPNVLPSSPNILPSSPNVLPSSPNLLPPAPGNGPFSSPGFTAALPREDSYNPVYPDDSASLMMGNDEFLNEEPQNFFNPYKPSGNLLKRM